MIIVLRKGATEEQIRGAVSAVEEAGLTAHLSRGVERTVIGMIGDERLIRREHFSMLPGVDTVIPILKPYKLASRDFRSEPTVVEARGVLIGDGNLSIIAGPCSVESEEQIMSVAAGVAAAGASLLRGGAFKPRTSPYAFQGLEKEGLRLLAAAREATGLGIVTEVMETEDVSLVADHADVLQVGARNMQNTKLLRALSKVSKPVLLKRSFAATMTELLMSAEYILSGGNPNVILCERGIRTISDHTRNTLDLSIVPALKAASHLPVIVDPSHGTGRRDLIGPMSRAAVAAGADGLMIEVHPDPSRALSDGEQSLSTAEFASVMTEVRTITSALGMSITGLNGRGSRPGRRPVLQNG